MFCAFYSTMKQLDATRNHNSDLFLPICLLSSDTLALFPFSLTFFPLVPAVIAGLIERGSCLLLI